MTNFNSMIKYFYPDAEEGKDFTVETRDNGEKYITSWNEEKLGKLPELKILHDRYIEFLKKQKKLSPKTDDTDPAPWLNSTTEKSRIARESFKFPIVNVDFRRGIVTQTGRVSE